MIRVVIESPFAGEPLAGAYLRACLVDSLGRGEAPYASHGLFPQVLDDAVAEERAQGMAAGFAWGEVGELRAFYIDLGFSPGMREGLRRAIALGQPMEVRKLGGPWTAGGCADDAA